MSSCCKENINKVSESNSHEKDASHNTDEHSDKKLSTYFAVTKNPAYILLIIFGVLLLLNLVAMSVFTIRVNEKLNEAINLSKPQIALLSVVVPDDCVLCGAMELERGLVSKQNIELRDTVIVFASSPEGKKLLETYKFTNLPAMVLRADEPITLSIKNAFKKGSSMVDDNTLVWEDLSPPYLDTLNNKVVGLVDVTYLIDESCGECYDVKQMQRQALGQFGVVVNSEIPIDVGSEIGRELIKTYNITSVPTMILSNELAVYTVLHNIWPQVGTIEPDGVYVFRNNEALGDVAYKDITTGKIITPEEN